MAENRSLHMTTGRRGGFLLAGGVGAGWMDDRGFRIREGGEGAAGGYDVDHKVT